MKKLADGLGEVIVTQAIERLNKRRTTAVVEVVERMIEGQSLIERAVEQLSAAGEILTAKIAALRAGEFHFDAEDQIVFTDARLRDWQPSNIYMPPILKF